MSAVHRILTAATITAVGLSCKAFLSLGFCSSVSVTGLHHLLSVLEDPERKFGRGVVTVSNHISVLDDPLIWGILPAQYYLSSYNMRWALGASDIIFTNPIFSEFFNHGHVWETFRGNGIYQTSVDNAIVKLNEGGWVHLFGEGKVNQPDIYPITVEKQLLKNGETKEISCARLPRFKWGTGRILMESHRLPVIIPLWLSGFDQVMPEDRTFPRFLPRFGKKVGITFGEPMDHYELSAILDPWRKEAVDDSPVSVKAALETSGFHVEIDTRRLKPTDYVPLGAESLKKRNTRIALTALVQRHVEKLGYSVDGPFLGHRIESKS